MRYAQCLCQSKLCKDVYPVSCSACTGKDSCMTVCFHSDRFSWGQAAQRSLIAQFAVSWGPSISVKRTAVIASFMVTIFDQVSGIVFFRLTDTLFVAHRSFKIWMTLEGEENLVLMPWEGYKKHVKSSCRFSSCLTVNTWRLINPRGFNYVERSDRCWFWE